VKRLDRGPPLVTAGGAGVHEPTVAQPGRPPDRDRLERPDPQGDGTLHGRRVEPDITQTMPAALEGDEIFGPEPSQHIHLLFHAAPAVTEVLVQGLELDRVPADADAEPRPSPVEDIELGGLLGDERGLALREDEDRGRELDPLGDRREVGEEEERLMEHPVPRIELRVRRAARGARPEHMVNRGQVVETEPLQRLDIVPDHGRIGPDLGLRKDRPDSHHLCLARLSRSQHIPVPGCGEPAHPEPSQPLQSERSG